MVVPNILVYSGARKPEEKVSLLYSSNYHDTFRQLTAIFRGLHVPCKILQFCLRLGWTWVMVIYGADKTGVAYKKRVTPWRWQLAAETCRGNLMSIIKTPLSICWLSCTGKQVVLDCSLYVQLFYDLYTKWYHSRSRYHNCHIQYSKELYNCNTINAFSATKRSDEYDDLLLFDF
jgi:hypothetical protein